MPAVDAKGYSKGQVPEFEVLQRRLRLYLIALWGRSIRAEIAPAAAEEIWRGPYIDHGDIHLPPDWAARPDGVDLSRAAAAHAAAHLVYGGSFPDVADLRPRQRALVGLIEDARVEHLACTRFPGLRRLWLGRLAENAATTQGGFTGLAQRLARALLDPIYQDKDAWVRKGIALFQTQRDRADDQGLAYDIGLRLAHDLGQMRLSMDEGKPFSVAEYRDDNRHLWRAEETSAASADPGEDDQRSPDIDNVFLREGDTGPSLELAEQRGREERPGAHHIRDEAEPVLEYRRRPGAPAENVYHYPEWNYRLQMMRQRWSTVREKTPPRGDVAHAEQRLTAYRTLLHRLRCVARDLRLERYRRVPRQRSGDEIDLDAAILSLVDKQAGLSPDDRVHLDTRPTHDQGLATLLLLDLSESTNAVITSGEQTVLELARDATLLLAHTMDTLGEAFAIHGFCSDSRHDIAYYRLKNFAATLDNAATARIAGISGRYSTRLGPALRHATAQLVEQPEQRKLLLVVTDGEPSDIDVYDPEYLTHDAREAVREAQRAGVTVFCLSLDPNAGRAVTRIFGAAHYAVLDRLARLPDRLVTLFLSLIRHY